MEDRYLFKARRTDNEEWVQGNLFFFKGKPYITERSRTFMTAYYDQESVVDFNMRAYEVSPNTICQCTELNNLTVDFAQEINMLASSLLEDVKSSMVDIQDKFDRFYYDIESLQLHLECTASKNKLQSNLGGNKNEQT